jgi:hypothetical protein
MGCDIHMAIEVRADGGEWRFVSLETVGRDYVLFRHLAGVRNYDECRVEPIAEPRGYPPDVDDVTRSTLEDLTSIQHSHSWLLLGEVRSHDWSTEPVWANTRATVERLVARANDLDIYSDGKADEAVRFVFGFDN